MVPTRELSSETMESVVKLIQEGNPQGSVVNDVDCSQSTVSKIWGKYKRNKMVKKEDILVDHENHQGVRIENANQYTLKIVNVQQNI